MKTALLSSILFLVVLVETTAQKDRYRFAESYYGLESEWDFQYQSFYTLKANGQKEKHTLPSSFSPRILIGGTHFWGRADFYISIPLGRLSISGNDKANLTNGVLTGFRAYPFRLQEKKLRPYVGLGFNNKEYQQEGENGSSQQYNNWQWYQEAGLSYYTKSKLLVELGLRYYPRSTYNVFISRDLMHETHTSPVSYSLAIKKVIDWSRSYSSVRVQQQLSSIKKEYKQLKVLSTYSIALGLSALIPLSKTELASQQAFLNDQIDGKLGPDLALGYYNAPLDAVLRVSYRSLRQKEEAYQYSYRLKKHAFALEGFKFIADYHGFVPFIGPYFSLDAYQLKEKDHGATLTDLTEIRPGYGLVFGWDIRLSEVESFILRTNLRYTPDLGYKVNGKKYTVKQLEFNFIQLVIYPERIKANRQLK
jgi:hypothetical protein